MIMQVFQLQMVVCNIQEWIYKAGWAPLNYQGGGGGGTFTFGPLLLTRQELPLTNQELYVQLC